MEPFIQMTCTVLCAVIASSGFWAYLQHRYDKQDVSKDMLLGLGHDRIMSLGMKYIQRGYVTKDEYENLYHYLYEPYEKMGGNGTAKRVMDEVKKLDWKDADFLLFNQEKGNNHAD